MHVNYGLRGCWFLLMFLAHSEAFQVSSSDVPLPLCGGNVTTDDTEIKSPGYPDPYPGGSHCLWTVIVDQGQQIYLTFDKFEVDGEDDLVEIYDEDGGGQRRIIGSFSGNQDQFLILSAGNKLQVNFTSSNTSSTNLHRRFHATFKTNEKGCGGTFSDSKSGVISAPIYNKDSQPPTGVVSCTWQINANTYHKVALSFDDTDLGMADLEVKDGFSSGAPLLANFTGGYVLPDVISTQNQVFVKLTFELGSPPKVKATFVEVSAECSGHIVLPETTSSYQIQSPNFPKPYPNNLDCRWLIESAHEMTTLVAIATSYQVNDINDVLTLHDGVSRSSNQMWAFRGSMHAKDVPWLVSSGRSLWIKFTTDETENQGFFQLDITAQESGGLVKNTTEAYFPSAPSTVFQCYAPIGYQCVFFTPFWNCTFNETGAVMSFYEGQIPDPDKLVHRYSAQYTDWTDEGAPAFSNGRMLLIVAENLGHGGNCVGSQIKILDDDSFQHSYGSTGSRLQPPKDTLYNGWVIHPNMTAGTLLQLSILKLDLIYEEFISITEVVNGQVNEIMAISKEWNGALTVYVTPASPITVAYLNIPEIAGRSLAYSMSYTMLQGCVEHLNSTKPGYVTSPDFPNRYPLNAICTWTISIEDNHLLHVIFEDLNLSDGHYISMSYNQQGPSDVGMRLSGNVRPNDLIIESSELQITFNTSARFTHPEKGFKIFYEAIECGGNMTSTSGGIASPNWPANVTQDITCMWVVDLPAMGDKNKPNIVQLHYDSHMPALQTSLNYFEIRDGPNSDSPLVAYQDGPNGTVYMGDVLSVAKQIQVLSRTNQMFVSYVFSRDSDHPSKMGFPFSMEYKLFTCDKQCNNGICLHESWRCDGVDQCGDNTDEQGCQTPIPDCNGYRTHMVAVWILGVSIAAAFIVAIIATLLALFTVRKYRANRQDDPSLLVNDD